MNTAQRRLQILGLDEVEAIYQRPNFTPEEREAYFSFTPEELATAKQFHSIKSRIYFLLQLGYFKARHLFFVFSIREVFADARYIVSTYFPDFQFTFFQINKVTRLKQQQQILQLENYRRCGEEQRLKLSMKAKTAASVCSKPVYIFRELMQFLQAQRLVAPGYSFMQDTVGQALEFEQNRLVSIVSKKIAPSEKKDLKQLLSDSAGLYEITLLKREPKDFSLKEIGREIGRREQIHHLYCLAQRIIPQMKISNESIKYYASLVTYYSVFRLKQLSEPVVYIYLLCFIYHRYQKLHDNLIKCFIYKIRGYLDEAKEHAKHRVYEARIEASENLQKAGVVLKLFTDDHFSEETPFGIVQAKAFSILERDKLSFVADHIATTARFDETEFAWEQIDTLAHQFKRQLRPILGAVDFAASKADDPLIEAIDFIKAAFQKGKSLSQYSDETFPTRFISDNVKRYLYAPESQGQKSLRKDRYEFLVYRLLRNGLESGDIFCQDSVRFRSFDDDLIDDKTWQKKEQLIEKTGLTILSQPIERHLATLEQMLSDRINSVNRRIISGENSHLEKKGGKLDRWTLRYPRSHEPNNHCFFDLLPQVDIDRVLHFVNQRCRFIDAFDHVLGRYIKSEADNRAITAALIAWGTNTGLSKMGEVSDIEYHRLKTTSDNFIRLETLREANDRVSNAIASLAIFPSYRLGESIHSSSDGQKFETRIHTINARHSSKYFGLKKGIVSYTLVANHVPINAKIIGANDHESHYVFDILFDNTTDIQPEIHSTDTHGTNEVNFALLHLFGYQFAPRYRDTHDKVSESLIGPKHPSKYGDLLIKPKRKIKDKLTASHQSGGNYSAVSPAPNQTRRGGIIPGIYLFEGLCKNPLNETAVLL